MDIPWDKLSEIAWSARDNAVIFSKTKVGAAVFSENLNIYSGCNVQQIFRSHDIHAEVNAIGNMVSRGDKKILAILIVAERDLFTPCGACMDWIMQFGGENCEIGFQSGTNSVIEFFRAGDMMPFYPR